jgi:hypothetical protein
MVLRSGRACRWRLEVRRRKDKIRGHKETVQVLTVRARGVAAAQRAFEIIEAAGIPREEVNVLACGNNVDRWLIVAPERNANEHRSSEVSPGALSGLARKLYEERKFLLGGFWAAGPCFREGARMAAAKGEIALDATLSRLGLGVRETTALELSLKRQGGVWLSVQGSVSRALGLEKSLRGLEDVEVKRFSVS